MILRMRAALGMEEDQSGTGELLDAEQIQLLAELAMIALLGFFQALQVCVLILLAEERRAVDALQLGIVLVAFPISAGDREQLERFESRGGRHVRTAAKIDEVRTERVLGENVVGAFLDQLVLHPVVGVFLRGRRSFGVSLRSKGRSLACSSHMRASIFSRSSGVNGRLALEIVIEAGVGGRSDAELGFGKQLQHGGRQQDAPSNAGRPCSASGFLEVRISSLASLSSGRVRSHSCPLTRATTASSARRGLIDFRDIHGTAAGRRRLLAAIGQSDW